MYKVIKKLEVCGAHRLELPYESKCKNLHGHNWKIEICLSAEKLNSCGMVADFALIKKGIEEKLDHKNFNDVVNFNPTAENLAFWIASYCEGEFSCNCDWVKVEESENNTACYAKSK